MDLASIADASRVMPRYLKEETVGMGVSAYVMEPEQLINIATVLSTLRWRPCGVQKVVKVFSDCCKREASGASSAVSSAYNRISSLTAAIEKPR